MPIFMKKNVPISQQQKTRMLLAQNLRKTKGANCQLSTFFIHPKVPFLSPAAICKASLFPKAPSKTKYTTLISVLIRFNKLFKVACTNNKNGESSTSLRFLLERTLVRPGLLFLVFRLFVFLLSICLSGASTSGFITR